MKNRNKSNLIKKLRAKKDNDPKTKTYAGRGRAEKVSTNRLQLDLELSCEQLHTSFGGKEYFELARKFCCNFAFRLKEGYCDDLITLKPFKGKCNKCQLGIALKKKYYEIDE